MSEDADDAQKIEKASIRKLEQSRERGDVPSSRELNTWVMLIGATVVFVMLIPTMMSDISLTLQRFIESSHEIPFEQSGLGAALLGMIAHVSSVLMVPAIILVIAAIGGNIVQKGVLFAPKKLEPSLKNISLKSGEKKYFQRTMPASSSKA